MQALSPGYSLPGDQILHQDPDSVPDAEAPLLPWTSTESLPVSLLDLGASLAEGLPGWGSASLVTQMVKNPPAMQETWPLSLGWEDPWKRAWKPTPVSLPVESHGQRSLAGCSPWGHKESDMTE